MGHLNTEVNLSRPDDVYERFIALHAGCGANESHKRNVKLLLALANHIGDETVILEAIALARGDTTPAGSKET